MSVSKFTSSSGLNDFNLNIQATNSTVIFDAEKSQGSYSISSSSNDTSIDFYAYASDGSLAGFTTNKSFTASRNFNKMVILGGTIGDVIGFTYKPTYATSQETAETTAGPYITGVSPSSLPNINNTITVTGGNFASGITATFYGSDANTYPAKSVVVGTPQSLIVTRPDVFPASANPYTLKVLNPGVADPTGSAVNVLSNGITAGNAPVWTTASGVIGVFSKNVPFSATVVATDADGGSTITYSVAPGYSLPAGLSLGSSSGIISGTPTVSTSATFNLRATDSGGNYVDRLFTLSDSGPVWITAGALTGYSPSSAYSYTLSAPDDSGTTPTFTLASGSLPTGLTLNSGTGVISGSAYAGATSGTSTFTVTATDANGTAVTSGTLTISYTFFVVGSSFTFTTAGVTDRSGPSLAQIQSAYSATSWTQNTANLTEAVNGYQQWTVPSTGTYTISCNGAKGGNISGNGAVGGKGALMSASFGLTAGQYVMFLVGQSGIDSVQTAGGGGGSFAAIGTAPGSSTLLVAAGGGGGASNSGGGGGGRDGTTANSGTAGSTANAGGSSGGAGGQQGSAGPGGYGGGGYSGSAAGDGGQSFTTSGLGGIGDDNGAGYGKNGGFGGGGGSMYRNNQGAGGGGGYSGGGAGWDSTTPSYGGGGGSYINTGLGTSLTQTAGSNNGAGFITVTRTA